MSFVKKTWKARLSEYPNRRILTDTTTNEQTRVTVARDEGTVSQQGDAFSAANMNDLEQRIYDAVEAGTYVEAVLQANTSTVTFTASWIVDGACYDVAMPIQYSKVIYTNIEYLGNNQLRLTFPQQAQAITVRLYKK